MNANIIARIANNVTRIANNSIVNNAKEHTSMNPFATMIRRTAQALGAIALLSLAQATVKADVVVETHPDGSFMFVGPQATYNEPPLNTVAAGATAMQIKVRNTDPNVGVTGVNIQTYIYLDTDVNNGWTVRAMPSSGAFSLAPGQDRWVTILIPNTSRQGQSLRGHHLYAKAIVDGHIYWLNDFVDASFSMDATVASITYNSDYTVSVKVQFTNTCHLPSLTQSVQMSYMPWAEGPLWTSPGQPAAQTLPALQPNQYAYLTFKTSSLQYLSYSSIYGWAQIGTEVTLGSEQAPAFQF